jgi:hypothetical protein
VLKQITEQASIALGQVAVGVAELRNEYGPDHGRTQVALAGTNGDLRGVSWRGDLGGARVRLQKHLCSTTGCWANLVGQPAAPGYPQLLLR